MKEPPENALGYTRAQAGEGEAWGPQTRDAPRTEATTR